MTPMTKTEAMAHRYGVWSGKPWGRRYDSSRCAEEIQNGWISYQCSRKPGHGPEELYCKQHAKQFGAKGG